MRQNNKRYYSGLCENPATSVDVMTGLGSCDDHVGIIALEGIANGETALTIQGSWEGHIA